MIDETNKVKIIGNTQKGLMKVKEKSMTINDRQKNWKSMENTQRLVKVKENQ